MVTKKVVELRVPSLSLDRTETHSPTMASNGPRILVRQKQETIGIKR